MEKSKEVSRRAVLQAMMELAKGAANDAVKLAYLAPEEREAIDKLDLRCLTEFKRSGNGTTEVKLTDRVDILAALLRQLEEERQERQRQKEQREREKQGPAAFLQALEHRDGPGEEAG